MSSGCSARSLDKSPHQPCGTNDPRTASREIIHSWLLHTHSKLWLDRSKQLKPHSSLLRSLWLSCICIDTGTQALQPCPRAFTVPQLLAQALTGHGNASYFAFSTPGYPRCALYTWELHFNLFVNFLSGQSFANLVPKLAGWMTLLQHVIQTSQRSGAKTRS